MTDKCKRCGKFLPEDRNCPHYCSFECCELDIVDSAAGLGVNEEAAVQEVLELCESEIGGCYN